MKRSWNRSLLQSLWGLAACLLLTLPGCSDDSATTRPLALSSPARIVPLEAQTLAVSDYTENRVCLVDETTLAVSFCFPTKGQPTGVAYSDYDGGRYYVGNRSVGSVDIYDARGAFLGHLGGRTNLFGRVNDLAVDPVKQRVLVLDSATREIRQFALSGLDTGVSFGAGDLRKPTALAVVPDTGEVLVSDFGDPASFIDPCPQIRVFTSDGSLDGSRAIVGSLGGGGMLGGCGGTGQFSAPQGVFVDSAHNVFVVDALTSKVLVFNLDTARDVPIKTLGQMGIGEGELFYPLDVAVDAVSQDLFVADNRNGRITAFSGGGVLP